MIKILLYVTFCCLITASQISIENNMARKIEGFASFLPNSGIDYAFREIDSGDSDVIVIDNDDLYDSNDTSGVISLNYVGSNIRICVAWNISNTNQNAEGMNLLAVFIGTVTQTNQALYNYMFSNQSPSNTEVMYQNANAGWMTLYPKYGIKINVFMSSDMDGDIILELEEYQRQPVGQFYIQAAGNGLYLTNWDITVEMDDFTFSQLYQYQWSIQPVLVSGTTYYTIQSEVPGYTFWWQESNGLLALNSVLNPSSNSFLWSIKYVTDNLYTIRSASKETFLDSNNCNFGSSTTSLPCYQGGKIQLSGVGSTTQIQFALFPIPLREQVTGVSQAY